MMFAGHTLLRVDDTAQNSIFMDSNIALLSAIIVVKNFITFKPLYLNHLKDVPGAAKTCDIRASLQKMKTAFM